MQLRAVRFRGGRRSNCFHFGVAGTTIYLGVKMIKRVLVVTLAVTSFVSIVAGRQGERSQPTFRAGVDLLQLDVSVIDKTRRPVLGLNASDFTVSIDGKPQPIVAFKAVELTQAVAPASAGTATWLRGVPADVTTNAAPTGRLVAILIDDFSFGDAQVGIMGIRKARQVAQTVVDQLGPEDRAAVIYGMSARQSQGFTAERALLSAAIGSSPSFSPTISTADTADATEAAATAAKAMTSDTQDYQKPEGIQKTGNPTSSADQQGACYCGACGIQALRDLATSLASVPGQRKVVMFVSAGTFAPAQRPNESPCMAVKRTLRDEALVQAQRANVTIEAIDPKGLTMGRLDLSSQQAGPPVSVAPTTAIAMNLMDDPTTARQEFLRTIAETTGGRAVVNNNDMELQVPALLEESGSYYLIGVEGLRPGKDGQKHSIRVRVNRPDLSVQTRDHYYDSTAKERASRALLAASPESRMAIAGPLATVGLPLEVVAVPIALPDRKSAVAITLGVAPPANDTRPLPRAEHVEVTAAAFVPDTGRRVGSRQVQFTLQWADDDPAVGRYEVQSRLPVNPGRLEIRVGLRRDDGTTASVYTYVDVPDFSRDDIALSGVFMETQPSPGLVAARAQLATLVDVSPTVRRTFARSEHVRALLRIYGRPTTPLAPATVRTRIIDADDRVAADTTTRLAQPSSTDGAALDHYFALPLADLTAGEYLLSFEVTADARRTVRYARFRVMPPPH